MAPLILAVFRTGDWPRFRFDPTIDRRSRPYPSVGEGARLCPSRPQKEDHCRTFHHGVEGRSRSRVALLCSCHATRPVHRSWRSFPVRPDAGNRAQFVWYYFTSKRYSCKTLAFRICYITSARCRGTASSNLFFFPLSESMIWYSCVCVHARKHMQCCWIPVENICVFSITAALTVNRTAGLYLDTHFNTW